MSGSGQGLGSNLALTLATVFQVKTVNTDPSNDHRMGLTCFFASQKKWKVLSVFGYRAVALCKEISGRFKAITHIDTGIPGGNCHQLGTRLNRVSCL